MRIIPAVFAIMLSACASHGVMVSQEQVNQFKNGETTEAQIIAALGQPTTVTTFSGQRMIVYSGAQVQARPASFIPIVGPLVGGSDVRSSSVVFRIGPDGILKDVISRQHASGSGTGLAAGTPIATVENQPRKPAE